MISFRTSFRVSFRDEDGSLAPAVPVIAFILLLLGGLGIDGSRQLNARGEAVAYAEEAARAGAQAVDVSADELTLNEPLVRQRVASYCAVVRKNPDVTDCRFVGIEAVSATDGRRLVVKTYVATRVGTTLLGMIGVHHFTAHADAKARPYEGIDTAEK